MDKTLFSVRFVGKTRQENIAKINNNLFLSIFISLLDFIIRSFEH